jgi:hypothetical protein
MHDRRRQFVAPARILVAVAALTLGGCKSYGSSSGPNPNMEALNERYGIDAGDKRADYVPLFLYYPDAPRPSAAPAAPARPAVASTQPVSKTG